MEKIVDFLVISFAVFCLVGAVLLLVGAINDYKTPDDYSYVDLNDNTGFADKCFSGRGGLICVSGDKEIMVKEFSKEEE